ncbi:MAG: inositol monophosphatase family protein [Candidatus Hodarchaeales archaeon]|jgi:myo-inositol-1(or 4)-monophosphatase
MWEEEIRVALEAIKEAQKVLLDFHEQDLDVEYKGKDNPVTKADIKTDKYLRETIISEFPADGWISEESQNDPSTLQQKQRIWVVDPIDGTQDFIDNTGDFCICVAFLVDSQPVFGFVAKPAEDKLYSAIHHSGASCNSKPIEVSNIKDPKDTRIAVSNFEKRRRLLENYLPDWMRKNVKTIGSTGLRMASVAEGAVDGFFCVWELGIWDICAASLIVEEAGGKVTDFSGSPINWKMLKHPSFLASNGLVHADLLKLLESDLHS